MWIDVKDDPPDNGQKCFVAAWEHGCEPRCYVADCFRSSANQAPKFYLDDTYRIDGQVEIYGVRLWMPVLEIAAEMRMELESLVEVVE